MSARTAMSFVSPACDFPAGLVTGIGSLPHIDAAEAVRFVAKWSPHMPYWPQLPRRSATEGCVAQGLSAVRHLLRPDDQYSRFQISRASEIFLRDGLERGDPSFREDDAAGFYAFLDTLDTDIAGQAVAVKGQVLGPVTLASLVLDQGDMPLLARSDGWLELFAGYVARQAGWQVEHLGLSGCPVVIFIDEPALCVIDHLATDPDRVVAALSAIVSALHQVGAQAGLHCCAFPPLDLIGRCGFDIVSFDACRYGAAVCTSGKLPVQGHLALGLISTSSDQPVPTHGKTDLDGPEGQAKLAFWNWMAAVNDPDILAESARRTLLTPACGLGLATPESARQVFATLHHLAPLFGQLADQGAVLRQDI